MRAESAKSSGKLSTIDSHALDVGVAWMAPAAISSPCNGSDEAFWLLGRRRASVHNRFLCNYSFPAPPPQKRVQREFERASGP
jgi:hypothetical protein